MQGMSRLARGSFWALLAMTACGRLALALAHHRSLLATELYSDDAFYYLRIAENLAAGRGLTFDGVTPTNGFHPLYLLLLVPAFLAAPGDLVFPIHASGVVLAAFATGTGVSLFALVRRLGGEAAALFALALWAICPYFVAHTMNGLETGVALFFVVTALWLYRRDIRGAAEIPTRRAIRFGVVCGMGMLARSDFALLLAAIGIDWLVAEGHAALHWPRTRAALVAAAAALVTWLPWGIVSRVETGAWLPLSGPASAEIARHVGWAVDMVHIWSAPGIWPFFDPARPPAAYYGDVLSKLVLIGLLEVPLLAPLRWNLPFSLWPDLRPFWLQQSFAADPIRVVLIALALGLGAVFVVVWRRAKGIRTSSTGLGWIAPVYGGMVLAAYTLYCPAHWYGSRYLIAAVLLVTVDVLGRVGRRLGEADRRRPIAGALACAAAVLILGVQVRNLSYFESFRWSETEVTGFLKRWQELEPKIPPGARVGSFQAGTYSYFGRRDIVNLDGKVNRGAYEALRDKRLHEYIRAERIDVVVEWEWLFYALCTRHLQPGQLSITPIDRGDGPFVASLYRVVAEGRPSGSVSSRPENRLWHARLNGPG